MAQILISPSLTKSALFKDRLRRHGLYYATKMLEREEVPLIIINSFWRSGSTLLLEFLADLFQLRPYFEPLVPNEEKVRVFFENTPSHDCNPDRFHPVLVNDGQREHFKQIIRTCSFHSKWVYQCQSRANFRAKQGKILKMVRGAHVLPNLSNMGSEIIHLSRDVYKVSQSFINSKWTNSFFEGVDLTYLAYSENPRVARFYKPYQAFLDLKKYSLVEQVAIYHTLSEKYVRLHNPGVRFVSYHEFLQNPEELARQLSLDLNLQYDSNNVQKLLKRPSRMTVHNPDKRKLTVEEKQKISNIISSIDLSA